jgi:hypothetical protein
VRAGRLTAPNLTDIWNQTPHLGFSTQSQGGIRVFWAVDSCGNKLVRKNKISATIIPPPHDSPSGGMMSFCPYCKEIVGNGATECPSCGMSWAGTEQPAAPPAPRIINEQPLPPAQPAYQAPPPQPAYQQPPPQPQYQQHMRRRDRR